MQAVTTLRHEETTASSFFGPLRKGACQVGFTIQIAAQNAPKIAILRLKMEKFSGDGA